MRKLVLSIFLAACLVSMAGRPAFAEAPIEPVLRGFDSAAFRFQLADILGTLLAIEGQGAQQCAFAIDDAVLREVSTWLERPSTQVADPSVFVTRRDQVEGIMEALLKLSPASVCNAAEDKLPTSLKSILRH